MCTYFVIGCEKEKRIVYLHVYIHPEMEAGVSCWLGAVGVSGVAWS